VQEKATESLVLLGGAESAAAISTRLQAAEGALQANLLWALGLLRDPASLEGVLSFAQKADIPSRGQDIALCLMAYGDKRGAEFGKKLLTSNLAHIRRSGAVLLAALGGADEASWRPLLEDKDESIRGPALVAAAKAGASPDIFTAALNDPSPALRTYATVASMLAKN
jgi:HEAT repeat protein